LKPPDTGLLTGLRTGQAIPYGGDRVAFVSEQLAAEFELGDRLLVVQTSGALLRIPAAIQRSVTVAMEHAIFAFEQLRELPHQRAAGFFRSLSDRLSDDAVWSQIVSANNLDCDLVPYFGGDHSRLRVDDVVRKQMITGVRGWIDKCESSRLISSVARSGWQLDTVASPLGVIGFVFEARPNVLVDAAGVVASGNVAVVRIGADAAFTAQSILSTCIQPALADAGLPFHSFILLPDSEHAAAWALFSHKSLSLAVARGSGRAVETLAAVARQSGVPVSVHGTGGAWLIADVLAEADRFWGAVVNSLDRKVCNTLNVCCVTRERAADLVPLLIDALKQVGRQLGKGARLHVVSGCERYLPQISRKDGVQIDTISVLDLAREWEWTDIPELSVVIAEDLDDAVRLFNYHSPRFIVSLISSDATAHERFRARVNAPFVGDGFTRWVDGQYAFGSPELGLSNWSGGRLLSRSGILSGDDLFTLRMFATHSSADQRR
jgi:glutamate-5-semialdehyde dehydrogenase